MDLTLNLFSADTQFFPYAFETASSETLPQNVQVVVVDSMPSRVGIRMPALPIKLKQLLIGGHGLQQLR